MTKPQTVTLDSEYRSRQADHHSLRLWLRLLTCTNLIETHLRNRLREEFDITLPRFDLMAQLDRHPEGLTMGQLTKLMMVSGGNTTGICNQLEKEGMIERETSATDRRSFVVKLSAQGKRHFKKLSRAHEEWVIELFSGLSDDGHGALMDELKQLKKSASNFRAQ